MNELWLILVVLIRNAIYITKSSGIILQYWLSHFRYNKCTYIPRNEHVIGEVEVIFSR